MTPATPDESTIGTQMKRKSRRQLLSAAAWMVVVCVTVMPLAGCGTAFTNGGIPEGRSVISGRVVASNNPQLPVPYVVVTVYATPTGESTVAYRKFTDAQGQFTFSGIVTGQRPTGSAPTVSSVTVAVNTDHTGYQSQQVSLLLTEARPVSVMLSVPPTGFDLTQVGSVSVTTTASGTNPPTPGVPFAFTAELLDHNLQPIVSTTTGHVYVPSLVLDNLSLVSIGANGTFEANGSSTGLTSIRGTVSLPNSLPSVNSDPVNLTVTNPQTVITGSTQQIAPGVPLPPGVPK